MKRAKGYVRSWAVGLIAGVALIGVAIAQTAVTITQVVNKATPTVTLATSNATPTYGGTVNLTATLGSNSQINTATGTVQFFDGGTALGSPVTVSGAAATLAIASLGGGPHSIMATYSGDSNFNSASSASSLAENVSPAPTTVNLASSLNPSIYQNNVSFTATTSAGSTGSITFMDDSTALGTVPLVGSSASFSIANLVAATHPITAVYSGDANWAGATSSAVSQVVDQAPTIETVTASPFSSQTVGSNVTFSALVNTGMLTPTGTATFTDGATMLGTGAVSVATAVNLLAYSQAFNQWTSDATGAAATLGAAVTGPDTIAGSATTIDYPDTMASNYAGLKTTAVGNFAGQTMVASIWIQAPSGTVFTFNLTDGSDGNLQTATRTANGGWDRMVVPISMPAGAAANAILSIGVTGQASLTATEYGAQLEQGVTTAGVYVATSGASASGQGGIATFSTTNLLEGSHQFAVAYSGDTNYLGGNGQMNHALQVGKGTATAVVASSNLAVSYGTNVTLTATVTGPDTTPTGTVTFYDGATSIGTGTLTSGVATLSTAVLTGGNHSITVQYGGDSNFNSATSAPITETVATALATLSATSTANPATYGDSITFNATMSGTGATPTGTVAVVDATTSTTLGTISLDATGKGSLTTQTLDVGSHTLTFTYSGDNNYQP